MFSLGIVIVMPVLFGTLIYLFLDHRNARTGFGGNEGILTWAGWMFTQPATFLFAIPAVGLLTEVPERVSRSDLRSEFRDAGLSEMIEVVWRSA